MLIVGISLAVQWLRLSTSTAEGTVPPCRGGTKIVRGPKKENQCLS